MSENFKRGSIYKITLENFMIYSNVEFFPGQSLNLIIGPNWSGKSSIIDAIILGLGGEPRDISKSKHITPFIKRGTEEAKIEIELYHKGKSKTIVITTTLRKSEKKMFYQKNHKTITKEELLNFAKGMGIQVSNLCQVLPQLRVHEFSKMNSQQLLVDTVSAISDFDGVTIRKDLIVKSKELKELEHKNQIFGKNVNTLEKLNASDESKVRDVEQQRRLQKEVMLYKMKENWLRYETLEKNVIEYKEKMDCENKVLEDLETKRKEKEKEKEDIANEMSCGEKSLNFTKKEIDSLEETIKNKNNSIISEERELKKIYDSLELKKTANLKSDTELKNLSDELEKMRLGLSEFENEYGNESSLQEQYKKNDEIIKELQKQKEKLERDISAIENDKRSIINNINTCNDDLEKLNEKYDTKVLLEQSYKDTHRAMKWLDQNRSLFQHRVYNPMLLEIDFDNEEDAKFLENTVSSKDLTAFCFEDKQDMEKFLKKVRELGYKQVNACELSTETNLRPPPIDEITQYGFSRYLCATFQAPAAVAQYLRARYRVHEVPLGDARTAHAHLPAHLRLYFTDKHRVSVKTSAYSGLQTKYTTFISPSKLLKSYKAPIKRIEETLNNLVNDKNDKIEKLERLKGDRDNLNQKIKVEEESNVDIRKKIDELKEITESIDKNQRLCEKERQIGKVDMKAEEARARQQQADITQALVTKQADLLQDVRRLHAAELYYGKLKKRFEDFQLKYSQCEQEVKELDLNLDDQKSKTEQIKKKIDDCNSNMGQIIKDIRDPEGKMPNDPKFLYKKQFNELPKTQMDLTVKRLEIQRDPKFTEDYSEYLPDVKKYQERVKAIEEKNSEIEENKEKIQELKDFIAEREPRWLSELQELVDTISERFKELFQKLGYTGKVLLDTDQDDVSKYGIDIMVSFSATPAQRLDAAHQSGGERSLATACYLLALQGVAATPFWCLDEINQNMDTENERNFLNLLMDVSSEDTYCQYFVLSPKLLKNLEYNDTVKVHVVMSGEFNVSSNLWETDNFLEKAKNYRNNNSDVDE